MLNELIPQGEVASYPLTILLASNETKEKLIKVPKGMVFFWSKLETNLTELDVSVTFRIDSSEIKTINKDTPFKAPKPYIVHKTIELLFTSTSSTNITIHFEPSGLIFIDKILPKEEPLPITIPNGEEAQNLLEQIRDLLKRQQELREKVIQISYPAGGGTKEVPAGTTIIDFFNGKVTLPGNRVEFTSTNLKSHQRNYVHNLYIEADQDIEYKLDEGGRLPKSAFDFLSVPHLTYQKLYIYTTEITKFDIFVTTNPETVVRRHRYIGYPGVKRPKSYEGTVTAGTPVYLTVLDDLGRLGTTGYITSDTNADLRVYISDDGINYHGGREELTNEYSTLKYLETLPFDGLRVHTIKLESASGTINYRSTII